ncbi:SGNH/GDSL hydrolase family protein [Massilia sp. P8910]|uniref:SGNH/GDSL hydrolase family protein n=1 Tax=Massilia antarctica TaxID=2765360 RepID=UPI001E5068AF|nr:SGNH/GDSL hydrolase family protein [Massilia antarctica]MCE3602752.1 SGNH/GDSL hydrolase family protein [Massilia antarctica]
MPAKLNPRTANQTVVPYKGKPLLKRIAYLGDSLTGHHTHPLIPKGVGFLVVNTPTNVLGGKQWLGGNVLDGRAPQGSSGLLETDGKARLRWTYAGDSNSPWIDVSKGGFFILPSTSYVFYVAVNGGQHPTSPGSDTLTAAGICQSITANMVTYAGMMQPLLGPEVESLYYGISGDRLEGVMGRWEQAVEKQPDALVVNIGTNNLLSTVADAIAAANKLIGVLGRMAAYVPKIYVAGLFPYSNVPLASRQVCGLYSALLSEFCATRPDVFRYWDAWHTLVAPELADGSPKPGTYAPDLIHLNPYGSYLAALVLKGRLQDDFALPSLDTISRGLARWDSVGRRGAITANPKLKGATGQGTGVGGVTGPVPDSWSVTRAVGAAQTCVLSQVATIGGQDALKMQVAGAAASEYHQLSQSLALPAGLGVGKMIAFQIDLEVLEATALTTFQAVIVANNNLQGAYALTSGRPMSNFGGPNQPRLVTACEAMKIAAGVTNITMSLRVGGNVGCTAQVLVRRFELVEVL